MIRNIRLVGVQFALIAMLLRALLPAGWMPNLAGQTSAPFIICSMDDFAVLALGEDGKPVKQQPDQNGDRSHEGCPFAAAPHLAPPAAQVAFGSSSLVHLGDYRIAQTQENRPIAGYAPQSPRAPPSFG
jgi:hypothetical protein